MHCRKMSHCPLNSTDNPPISYVFVVSFLDAGDYSQIWRLFSSSIKFSTVEEQHVFLNLTCAAFQVGNPVPKGAPHGDTVPASVIQEMER